MNLNQVTLPAVDIERAKLFYHSLGLHLIVDTAHYLRFESPEGDSTLSIHLVDKVANGNGIVIYFECADLDDRVSELVENGITFNLMPTDQTWLWREARLTDPDGNQIILYHGGENRKNPPWRVN